MDTTKRYRNRAEELSRLINVLRSQGICGVEELTTMLTRTIRGYAAQLFIEHLRPREIEYIWMRLID